MASKMIRVSEKVYDALKAEATAQRRTMTAVLEGMLERPAISVGVMRAPFQSYVRELSREKPEDIP